MRCKACQGEGVEWNSRDNIPPRLLQYCCCICRGTGVEPESNLLTPAEQDYLDRLTIDVCIDGHSVWQVDLKISEIEPGSTIKINVPVGYGRKKK